MLLQGGLFATLFVIGASGHVGFRREKEEKREKERGEEKEKEKQKNRENEREQNKIREEMEPMEDSIEWKIREKITTLRNTTITQMPIKLLWKPMKNSTTRLKNCSSATYKS